MANFHENVYAQNIKNVKNSFRMLKPETRKLLVKHPYLHQPHFSVGIKNEINSNHFEKVPKNQNNTAE